MFASLLVASGLSLPTADVTSTFPTFVQYSAAAYCNQIWTSGAFNCGIRCSGKLSSTQIIVAANDSATTGAGFVGVNPDLQTIVISFRGTSNPTADGEDLDFFKSNADFQSAKPIDVPNPANSPLPTSLQIHTGFKNTYEGVRQAILPAAANLAAQYPSYQIVFTGHSLGGALAGLAAVDFQNVYGYDDRISLYTYGQPRIGDTNWARYVDGLSIANRFYRVARVGDPVVHLPYNWMGFQHFRHQYEINDDGTTTACSIDSNSGESSSCLNDGGEFNVARHSDYYGWLNGQSTC
ncbi:hypothetical protein HK103_002403 [Boothiomyces macroporosus]|uniref:Fungal lipase-type domain-containing protein n=1 Tax=Boothiomyces macroporosus TaxID=261099 RepID=A0AAD5Y2K7_9FUNG|nr:hypothetical protein HK103_002403 [Boothiomyces macroporosus]